MKSFGVCIEHKKLSMVMEYCQRGTLVHVMSDPNIQISFENAMDFFVQAVEGIRYLHEGVPDQAIVHRDLKSQNLLVTGDFRIKVGDFGLSRFNTVSNGTTLGNLCGTMSHCAPEIYMGDRFSPKSDVYSLGMILWELTDRVAKGFYTAPYKEYPFICMDLQIVIQACLKNLRPTIDEAVPEPIGDLIRRCWSGDPAVRPTAGELAEIVRDFPRKRLKSETGTLSPEPGSPAQGRRAPSAVEQILGLSPQRAPSRGVVFPRVAVTNLPEDHASAGRPPVQPDRQDGNPLLSLLLPPTLDC